MSNSEHTTVIFFDVILKNAKISSSTAKNSLKMLKEKFIKISETEKWTFIFPEALENFMKVSTGSKILMPLLSIVNPRAFAFISIVSPFRTSLEATQLHETSSDLHLMSYFVNLCKANSINFYTSESKNLQFMKRKIMTAGAIGEGKTLDV